MRISKCCTTQGLRGGIPTPLRDGISRLAARRSIQHNPWPIQKRHYKAAILDTSGESVCKTESAPTPHAAVDNAGGTAFMQVLAQRPRTIG